MTSYAMYMYCWTFGRNTLSKKKMERTLVVAVDFTAAFDRVWRGGLLRQLAEAGIPHLWLRWIRSWLADRKARVRWGRSLGKWRKLHQGVPQGSPLSPLLFIISTAPIPEVIRAASPECRPDAYADDLSLSTTNQEVQVAAASTQRALDALEEWCDRNYFRIAPDKTEAMVITTDPRKVNGKARPPLHLGGQQISVKPTITVLGVTIDSQLTFAHHTRAAADKLRRRCSVLRMVAAKSWGADTRTLHHLYISFVRPAAMYAAGQWFPFAAGATREKLEAVNSGAARIITGVGAGSRSATTLCDAEISPLRTVAHSEAAALLLNYRRQPENHHLRKLAAPPGHPRRLKARGTGGLRPCWRSTAMSTLEEVGLQNTHPEERVPHQLTTPPWKARTNVTFHFVPGTSREDPPAVRQALALEFLHTLRLFAPPNLEVWTDGAAKDGTHHGGGGYTISWPAPGPDTVGSVAAGTVTNSTAAEAAALAAALQVVCAELLAAHNKYTIWVLFDSRALLERLRRPDPARLDLATAEALRRIHGLAEEHQILVIWVPGHAGLPQNEVADQAARAGSDLPQPTTNPTFRSAVNHLRKGLLTNLREEYRRTVPPDNLHRRASDGLPPPRDKTRTRAGDVALFQLRANRLPHLRATQHLWGRVPSPVCPHCNAPKEDTEHFLLHCPKWSKEREDHLRPGDDVTILQTSIRGSLAFTEAAGVLRRPPYASAAGQ